MSRRFPTDAERATVAVLQALTPTDDAETLEVVRGIRRAVAASYERLHAAQVELSEKLSWQDRVIRLCDYLIHQGGEAKVIR